MKISIVTPSFNQVDYLEEALWSVKNQEYPDVEHVVIDGGSSDGSKEMLLAYSARPGWNHLLWRSERDRGQSNALNKGFRWATGDVIGWLNSDDRYLPGCFVKLAKEFAANPRIDVLYGDYNWIDINGRIIQRRREIEFSPFILHFHRVLYIPTTATFFQRRVFDDGNYLDESLHYAMDYEFFLRLEQRGYRFAHIPQMLADFRCHQRSKSQLGLTEQLIEHDTIAHSHSGAVRRLRIRALRNGVFLILRFVAGMLRWGQKLLRGFYFTQYKVK